jgi:uncharacterized membrane protein
MNILTINSPKWSRKIAAILALFISVMSVFAGLKVLLEIDIKDYNVLVWLVLYNVIFGAISIVVAYFIWKNYTKAKKLTLFVLAMHLMVFLYLKFMSTTVASESIKAMLFRTSIWALIAVLALIIPTYLGNQKQ